MTGLDMPALSVGTSAEPGLPLQQGFAFKGTLYDSATHKLFYGVVNVGTTEANGSNDCTTGNQYGTHQYFSKANGYGAPIPAAQSKGRVLLPRRAAALRRDRLHRDVQLRRDAAGDHPAHRVPVERPRRWGVGGRRCRPRPVRP